MSENGVYPEVYRPPQGEVLLSCECDFILLLACRLTREKGFTFKQDGEHGFRRVVASPEPLKILEATAIKVLPCQRSYCHHLAKAAARPAHRICLAYASFTSPTESQEHWA